MVFYRVNMVVVFVFMSWACLAQKTTANKPIAQFDKYNFVEGDSFFSMSVVDNSFKAILSVGREISSGKRFGGNELSVKYGNWIGGVRTMNVSSFLQEPMRVTLHYILSGNGRLPGSEVSLGKESLTISNVDSSSLLGSFIDMSSNYISFSFQDSLEEYVSEVKYTPDGVTYSNGGNRLYTLPNEKAFAGATIVSNAAQELTFAPTNYTVLDSATIYNLKKVKDFTLLSCSDCTGNGVVGRVLLYVQGVWRRLTFE